MSSPVAQPRPAAYARATAWAAMAKGERRIGQVRSRPGKDGERWYIDFGRRWGPRFLYSFRGVRFESEHMAEAILSHVEMEIAKSRQLEDVLSELAPQASSGAEISTFAER